MEQRSNLPPPGPAHVAEVSGAVLSDVLGSLPEGVAVVEGIWWNKHQPGGRGVNALTDDRTADMGGGPALHSNLVQVERLG